MLAVEVAAHEDVEASTATPTRLLGQLQRGPLGGDDVGAADAALVFGAEDVLELDAARGDKGRGGIGGRAAELGIEGGEKVLAQVAIGRRHGRDAGDTP